MAQISQTNETVEILFHMNKISNIKPNIVVFQNFVKYNCPPVYFEWFLADEIDEENSVCKLLKKDVKFILKKKNPGIWPKILKDISKDEALKKKKEIDEILRKRNEEKDKEAINQFEEIKRDEIRKVVQRESNIREKITSLEKQACQEELVVIKAETPKENSIKINKPPSKPVGIRTGGKINIKFSNFNLKTPKRESQLSEPLDK